MSVSRVGGAAQTKIIKKLGGGVRLALAQFRELEAFAQFASDLDETTRKQLERGQRITELMKQKQYAPQSVAEMATSLFMADRGYLDDVELKQVVSFEAAVIDYMGTQHADLMAKINSECALTDEIDKALSAAIETFKKTASW